MCTILTRLMFRYEDTSNLQRNLQRHNAFHTEVTGNTVRIDALETESARLISSNILEVQFPPQAIESDMSGLRDAWTALLAESTSRGTKLNDVIAEYSFYQKTDDLQAWILSTETALSSTEVGADLSTAKLLLKQHEQLTSDIAAHAAGLSEISDAADVIVAAGNFRASEVSALTFQPRDVWLNVSYFCR